MKKKILSLILAAAMVFSITACGGGNQTSSNSATTTESKSETETTETPTIDWPEQPVNVMCPAAAGGGTDIMLRLVNEYFVKNTSQSFVINNVTGISGYEQVHQGNPDGYDYIAGTTSIFTTKIEGTLDYDWEDYEIAAFIEGDYATCVAVQASSPYQTINDLLDAAKNDPSISGGITLQGQPLFFAKALADQTGIDLYYVDTGTTSERNAALLGGQVDYIITNTAAAQAYVESGDFRILANDGRERSELAPDVPTFIEQGVDFCFVPQPIVWMAPKGTPKEYLEAFNARLAEIYADPEFQPALKELGFIAKPVPSVDESVEKCKEFAAALAPYVEAK